MIKVYSVNDSFDLSMVKGLIMINFINENAFLIQNLYYVLLFYTNVVKRPCKLIFSDIGELGAGGPLKSTFCELAIYSVCK